MRAFEVYKGSDGEATRKLYSDLATFGSIGIIAVNLFRAQKTSERAKKYRGGIPGKGSYRSMSYDRKNWSLEQLCMTLETYKSFRWGWQEDPHTPGFPWVLYVDLPTGQCSFHSAARGKGPDYPGKWDGQPNMSAQRIIAFCDQVLGEKHA